MLAAIMINPMTCTMGHMMLPFALCFYVCIGIAQSDFKGMKKLAIIWCVGQGIAAGLLCGYFTFL